MFPMCAKCEREGRTQEANLSHHINEYRESFSELEFWYGPLESLCFDCHAIIHDRARPRDYQTDIGLDGYALDPNHPTNRIEALSYEERMARKNSGKNKDKI
jgi:hypothetical protein